MRSLLRLRRTERDVLVEEEILGLHDAPVLEAPVEALGPPPLNEPRL